MTRIESLGSAEFQELFKTASKHVFRLEVLQHYAMPYEDDHFQSFLAGQKRYTDPGHMGYLEKVRTVVARGVKYQRVHVVKEPLSDYVSYELLWPYYDNVRAGETIGIVPTKDGNWPTNLPKFDFWLFDERVAVKMNYNEDGEFVDAEILTQENCTKVYAKWRQAALQQATEYQTYIEELCR